jgi:hypothetical protein
MGELATLPDEVVSFDAATNQVRINPVARAAYL